mmetsp:Transcript_28214/g.58563  ORF Transcript_28214/g.58563 Transcript_28214/m.58563 type:complete len:273 (-) Transcript_28214:23-841(-)
MDVVLFPNACGNCNRARFRGPMSRCGQKADYLKCPYCKHCNAPSGCREGHACGSCTLASKLPLYETSSPPHDVVMYATIHHLNEILFKAEDKDVTIKCSDGAVWAHKCVLSAISDAFKVALSVDMREKAAGTISIEDVTKDGMNIFLCLAYTGHASAEDWGKTDSVMPLEHLCCAAKLAKRYMVEAVQLLTTQMLKRRLEQAFLNEGVEAFTEIYSMGISLDIGDLRVRALQLAQHFSKLKAAKEIPGNVQSELQCLWPRSNWPRNKRARLV